MSDYKNLEAWKKSMLLVKEVYIIAETFPRHELYGISSQVKRAAASIPSNIAEGCGRQYKRDTKQFLHIARGSLYELETILNVAVMVSFLPPDKFVNMVSLIDENARILNGLITRFEREDLK